MANANLIDAILASKGYRLSFEQAVPGSVVCLASKDSTQLRVLARSVSEGITELARMMGLNTHWYRS